MMIDLTYAQIRKQLSFCEAIILMENINQRTTLTTLNARLIHLLENTRDEQLRDDLNSLLFKLTELTPDAFAKLKQDTLLGLVLFPPDYIIQTTN